MSSKSRKEERKTTLYLDFHFKDTDDASPRLEMFNAATEAGSLSRADKRTEPSEL